MQDWLRAGATSHGGLRAAGGEGALCREVQDHGSKQAFPETLGESVQLGSSSTDGVSPRVSSPSAEVGFMV